MCSRTTTEAYLPSNAPSSGIVRNWCMLNVFDGLCFVVSLLTGTGFSTRMHVQKKRRADLGGMVGRSWSHSSEVSDYLYQKFHE